MCIYLPLSAKIDFGGLALGNINTVTGIAVYVYVGLEVYMYVYS